MTEISITSKKELAMVVLGSKVRAGMTTEQLSEKSGVSTKDIEDIESGKLNEVSVDVLIDLLSATEAELVVRQDSASGPRPKRAIKEVTAALEDDEDQPADPVVIVADDLREWKPGERRAFLIHGTPELGHALMMARIRKGLSQQQAADGLGMHSPSVCKHETGANGVTVETLSKYADFYGVEFVIGPKRPTA